MNSDIPRHNQEHYCDETAHDALAAVAAAKADLSHRRKRLLVFICSPYSGNIEYNIRRARSYCRFAISRNCVPIAVHLHYTQFLDDAVRRERNIGLSCGVTVLRRCDQLWIFGDRITEGMKGEIEAAKRFGIPIRRFNSICKEVNPV
jgi:hypothetical protein